MPFVTREDLSTTQRKRMTPRRRLEAWERTRGVCVVCERMIDGVRDRWIVEHIRALELGGTDELDNMGPAHEACGRLKTREDHRRTARAKRQKLAHLGARETKWPLPTSRQGMLKRKVDGTVVRREREVSPPFSARRSHEHSVHDMVNANRPRAISRTETGSHQAPQASSGAHDSPKVQGTMPARPNRPATVDTSTGPLGAEQEILPPCPAGAEFVFEERPLLRGEDGKVYDQLLNAMLTEVRPKDLIEAIWVRDIVDNVWEARRLKRWRAQILNRAKIRALEDMIHDGVRIEVGAINYNIGVTFEDPAGLAAGWMTGDKAKTARVNELLVLSGRSDESVEAHGFLLQLSEIERIDRMRAAVDQRRDALLREIERRRSTRAQQLRQFSEEISDADGDQ